MGIPRLIRWSGMALGFSGIILVIAMLLHPRGAAFSETLERRWTPVHIAEGLVYLLNLLGLSGLYLKQAEKAGVLGLCGFVLTLFGSAFGLSVAVDEVVLYPFIAAQEYAPKTWFDLAGLAWPLAGLVVPLLLDIIFFDLGVILTGVTIVRAGILPRRLGWLILIGIALSIGAFLSPAIYSLFYIGEMVLGIGFAWAGYALWSGKDQMAAQYIPTG